MLRDDAVMPVFYHAAVMALPLPGRDGKVDIIVTLVERHDAAAPLDD